MVKWEQKLFNAILSVIKQSLYGCVWWVVWVSYYEGFRLRYFNRSAMIPVVVNYSLVAL